MRMRPTAIDLFAGAGGATQGLADAGFSIVAAVEKDADAAASLSANGVARRVFPEDIRKISPAQLRLELGLAREDLALLTACPPCQGFSSLGNGDRSDSRNDLIFEVDRFLEEFLPQCLLLENVPGLEKDERFARFVERLRALGYQERSYVLDASDFGVPQRRRRLILIALRGQAPPLSDNDLRRYLPDSFRYDSMDAAAAIAEAGPTEGSSDPIHRHRLHSPAVLERLAAIPIGGGRHHLPPEHRLPCHDRIANRGASSVYGRIPPTGPAPTLTTRCTSPSCGRYVHPTEHRGITLREAALLQTFPRSYQFLGKYGAIERQIGNAIPVRFAEALGRITLALIGGSQTEEGCHDGHQ